LEKFADIDIDISIFFQVKFKKENTVALSTNLISGLTSGFDWRSMIDQLMAVEHRPVDLVKAKKTDTETKIKEWQTANTKLLALKTAAVGLKDPDIFQVFSASMSTNSSAVKASDLLSVSTTAMAAPGTYNLKVTNLAQAQKLSSNPFTSQTTALGSNRAGDIVINGKVITINAMDTLAGVASRINNLNTGSSPSGVTASVINFGANDYRLILTSDKTGAKGINLLNGSSVNSVQAFGWKDNQAATIKNSITLGAQSDRFTSSNVAVKSLLGLTTGESASVTIGGTSVAINLSAMSLTDIKTAINTAAPAGVSASVISETIDNTTYYRLQIDGAQTFSDTNNILNTLGVLDHTNTDVSGKVSDISMTSNGTYITAATVLKDIDGYNTFTAGGFPASDYLTLTGMDTSNVAVNTNFSITNSTTVQNLLDEIKTRYGNVLAYVTNDGKIRVDDLSGGSVLTLNLTDHIANVNSKLEFVALDANFGAAAVRQRQIIAGEDAVIELDGVTVTNASNTIKDVIAGTTLNLIKEDAATTINLTVGRNLDTMKKNIQDYVGKYNDLMSYINTQFSYDMEKKTTGGALFGDGTLSSVKSDISALTTQTIWGVNSNFSIMGMIGINLDNNQLLKIDDALLTRYLQTNFNEVKALFTTQGNASSTSLAYITATKDSKAGDYTVHINRAATRATATGTVNLTAGSAADTLTVVQGASTANIAITAGMIITDIVNAVNTEFSAVYTQALSGSMQLKQSDNVTAIAAGTAWNNILGATLQNGDVLNFTGTSRSGSNIGGSYTITNTATDKVQGLLSAIENAYSYHVTASISSSGRITLTDKFTGTSQLAIDIVEPAARGLDFGTLLTSNTDGVVGRYALAMTADDDGSGHLVIRNNDYGSGNSFTVSQGSMDLNYDQMIYTATANTTSVTNGAAYCTDATTWNDVYGANVANGDTITIGGMARDGATPISGTYTITDKTTDTFNGLFIAIENAYSAQGTTVDVVIRDGKIYVEDLTTGASFLALTLAANNQGGGTLALGTYNQSTRRDMNLGLVDGTYAGQDVAGTINGETATGSGQNLTGANGNANTAGLSIKYTGAANGADAGTIKLTLGLAALLDNTLFTITDSVSGYVPFKQKSLQDSADSFATQISEMEARLAQKQEMMVNRFVAMELALSKIQNQSNWLTGQLTSASNGWQKE
jgi:flagellar hook-associated protein 2